jgi:predicted SAM-dependent methyltransferase
MNAPQILKQSDTVVELFRYLRNNVTLMKKKMIRDKLIKSYLESNEIKKLQIGAGPTILSGWLSTDINPDHPKAVYLDATKVFPFEDNTFNYIFCEHMIEHVPYNSGLSMLKECRRVLKPGGIMRITTPDLEVLIGLYLQNGNPLNERYIEWITDTFLSDISVYKASFVINNAFHAWGHKFLYDGDLLAMTMQKTGFTNIKRYSPGQSNDENLKGIETHGKNANEDEMVRFETMFFEGTVTL